MRKIVKSKVITYPFTRQQMNMLERRQREEVEAMRWQAQAEKQAMSKNMQMMKEAGMNSRRQYQQQLNAADEREKQANQSLQSMRQWYDYEKQQGLTQKRNFDENMRISAANSRQAQSQIQQQLNSYAAKERQTNHTLRNITQQRDNDRIQMDHLRGQTEDLQSQLYEAEANKTECVVS